MSEKPLYIGLAGFGIVGSGLCRLLEDNDDIIYRRTGRRIVVKTILVRDLAKKRDVPLPQGARLTAEMAEMLDDPEIDAIVELMGGINEAGQLVRQALARGKHVVTANKALLAEDGLELLRLARSTNSLLRYEASVAGAIPIISTLKESLTGNQILSLMGILNGTSNYILSAMSTENLDFAVALAQAQELGFAEADPSLDIDGYDAAHKLIILIRLAFGLDYPLADLSVSGIRGLSALDIRLTREFGYRVKLIGQVCALKDDKTGETRLAAGVFPALVHHTLLLGRVGGAYNALRVMANAAGPLFFHGKGAGSLPTAGAVLADLIAVAKGEYPNNSGYANSDLPPAARVPMDEWPACYYVRLMVADTPGVLRDISACMAAENISVAQMIQKRETASGNVPLVFMTHVTCGRAMKAALARAASLGLLREEAVFFRVLEKES